MMRRREFLETVAAASAGLGLRGARGDDAGFPPGFRLSRHGCGRATGYAETNKIVTVGNKTHVAWLDSVADGFRVRLRTLARKTGTWSPTYTIGEAYDNHGGPALTVDREGHLHAVYYPHHHALRYRRSTRPNDASGWDDEIRFGERCTYPTLVCAPDDTLLLTCRESRPGNEPWVVGLYTKPPGGRWQRQATMLRAEHGGYAHFQEALAWGHDGHTLHLSCRIYGGNPRRGHTVGYLRSPDFGQTWLRGDDKRVEIPASASTVDVIAGEKQGEGPGLRCGAIAVDASGRPHVLYSTTARRPFEAWIATLEKPGRWRRRALLPLVAKRWPGRGLTMPGGITISPDGVVTIVLTLIEPAANTDESVWGHPSSELLRLRSTDGGERFTVTPVSTPDPSVAHWLPNLERPTGHNRVDSPGLIYTAGAKGTDNRQIVANDVNWVAPGLPRAETRLRP